jgi:dTDP-4-dehydrorhamnose reductase
MIKKKVVVIGAGGIVGQHMMINKPDWADAVFTRRVGKDGWVQLNVGEDDVAAWLDKIKPDVIINLAGQNIVDAVEENPDNYIGVNVDLPLLLARWINKNNRHLIQVSTQGIFSGENPEYSTSSKPHPVTWYGKQKALAEKLVMPYDNVQIARLTFVIGVRPFQDTGRKNPLELMLEQKSQLQVNDRFFSPVFASDAAEILWEKALSCEDKKEKIIHIGNPIRCSRFSLANDLKESSDGKLDITIEPVSYTHFASDVARPRDTTWQAGSCLYKTDYMSGLNKYYLEWKKIQNEPRNTFD